MSGKPGEGHRSLLIATVSTVRMYCTYYDEFDSVAKSNYDEKLNMLPGSVDDPYVDKHFQPGCMVSHLLPEVQYPVWTVCSSTMASTKKWCYCQSEEHGTMIVCDNDMCSIGWYHTDCLNTDTIPIVYLTSPEPSKNCYNLSTLHPI